VPVIKLETLKRGLFAGGANYGLVGQYELLEGIAHFAVDPLHASNRPITDIELAPRDAKRCVNFTAHLAILRPVNRTKGNRRLLFDVVNRGRKLALTFFNSTGKGTDPTFQLEPGNGWLMRQGYTVVWCGWQADVPPNPLLMGMQAPEALDSDGKPLTGRILCQFQSNEPTKVFLLAHQEHLPHPPADADEKDALLTVRDHPNEPAQTIPRGKWRFVRLGSDAEPHHVQLDSGFEPGRIYQLVYTTRGSKIVGLGFAAMRDMVSFLRYEPERAGNPCGGDIGHAYGFGVSQSGRFLRQFIHLGLNEDEQGRHALDGLIPHVAGGMRGEFNLRFGQPSKDICYIMPELFPFSDVEQADPETGRKGALLDRMAVRGRVPKIMFTNTSAEYWRGDAALIHTDIARMSDAPESEHVRRYHFGGTQHGPGFLPLITVRPVDGARGQLPFNGVDYTPLLRACLENLHAWATQGKAPPPSKHPTLKDGTAVESGTLAGKFARLPGVKFPPRTLQAMRLDFGPEAHLGGTTMLPPVPGKPYPALVSEVDEDCNDIAGIRLPEVSVPLATHTGWILRHPAIGNPILPIGVTGGLAGWTLPFCTTRAERLSKGDPRPSIEERYASKDDYLRRVRVAAQRLVAEGYLLEEDVESVTKRAGLAYDLFSGDKKA
jgi:hypothetical protein